MQKKRAVKEAIKNRIKVESLDLSDEDDSLEFLEPEDPATFGNQNQAKTVTAAEMLMNTRSMKQQSATQRKKQEE